MDITMYLGTCLVAIHGSVLSPLYRLRNEVNLAQALHGFNVGVRDFTATDTDILHAPV